MGNEARSNVADVVLYIYIFGLLATEYKYQILLYPKKKKQKRKYYTHKCVAAGCNIVGASNI